MAKNDRDLFNRLRSAGLRKQVAKTLSGIGEDTGKKALRAARSAVSELRSLADDIEGRLPSLPGTSSGSSSSAGTARRPAARRASTGTASARRSGGRSRAASTGTARRTTRRSTAAKASTARKPGAAARKPAAGGRAPRGANKAKILASLKAGPKTAAEIAKETGIGVGTVGSTLTKMAGSGEVQKAARGYALPK